MTDLPTGSTPAPEDRLEEQPPGDRPHPPASVGARQPWNEMAAESLPAVQASAGKWRDGLAALITLVTAAKWCSTSIVPRPAPTG